MFHRLGSLEAEAETVYWGSIHVKGREKKTRLGRGGRGTVRPNKGSASSRGALEREVPVSVPCIQATWWDRWDPFLLSHLGKAALGPRGSLQPRDPNGAEDWRLCAEPSPPLPTPTAGQ